MMFCRSFSFSFKTRLAMADPGQPSAGKVGKVPLLDESRSEPPELTRDSPFTGGDGRPSEPEAW